MTNDTSRLVRSGPKIYRRTQQSAAKVIERLLDNTARLFEDASLALARGDEKDSDGGELMRPVVSTLSNVAQYLRDRSGIGIVDQGFRFARSNPLLFVSAAGIASASAAYFLLAASARAEATEP